MGSETAVEMSQKDPFAQELFPVCITCSDSLKSSERGCSSGVLGNVRVFLTCLNSEAEGKSRHLVITYSICGEICPRNCISVQRELDNQMAWRRAEGAKGRDSISLLPHRPEMFNYRISLACWKSLSLKNRGN